MTFSLGTSKDNLIYAGGFYKRIHVQLFVVHFYEYVAFYFVDVIVMNFQRLIMWWQGRVQLYHMVHSNSIGLENFVTLVN